MPSSPARTPTLDRSRPTRVAPRPRGPEARGVRRRGAEDGSSTRGRIVDGALACLGRQGTAKTTVDDIARAAGLSRATLYRTFPKGKDAVLAAVVETEWARFFSALAVVMDEATDLEALVVGAMVGAARRLSAHQVLRYLVDHEPQVILPQLAFAKMDRVLEVVGAAAAPFFARWMEPAESTRAAEWTARIVLSYLCSPDRAVDLTRPEDARRLARAHVLPGILALHRGGSATPASGTDATTSPRQGGHER